MDPSGLCAQSTSVSFADSWLCSNDIKLTDYTTGGSYQQEWWVGIKTGGDKTAGLLQCLQPVFECGHNKRDGNHRATTLHWLLIMFFTWMRTSGPSALSLYARKSSRISFLQRQKESPSTQQKTTEKTVGFSLPSIKCFYTTHCIWKLPAQ